MTERWEFQVMQGGIVVAEGDAPDRDSALREAGHYVMMYGQDGACSAIVKPVMEQERSHRMTEPKHEWFFYDRLQCDCCRNCGIIRRADGKNNPCRGVAGVGPRASEQQVDGK